MSGNFYFLLLSNGMTILVQRMHVFNKIYKTSLTCVKTNQTSAYVIKIS